MTKRSKKAQQSKEREKEYDKKVEEVTKRCRKYIDSLSIEEMKKMLVNYMVDSYMEGEDDPYEDEDYY